MLEMLMITPARFDHVLGGFARAEKDAAQVDGDDLVEIVDRHFCDDLAILDLHQKAVPGDPRVIDEPVYASEVPFNIFKERDDRLLVGNVGFVAFDFDSRFGAKIDRLLQIRFV